MPSPRRLLVPIGDRTRPGRGSQRVSALAVILTVLALGGAVAGVYTTGVTLGARIAPRDDDRPGAAPGRPGATDGERADGTDPDGPTSSLPDRVSTPSTTGSTPPGTDGTAPGRSDPPGPTGDTGGATPPSGGDTDPVGAYQGLWPYTSWDEVRQHRDRGDRRFTDPAATALQFAREVVGLTGPTVGSVDAGGTRASVGVRVGGQTTVVTLTRAVPDGPTRGAPWSVTGARGPVSLDAPAAVGGASLAVTSTGSPGVVGVHDRSAWRGIGVAPSPGAPVEVRVEPGAAGPAMVVAFAGDPRDPAGFAVQRVELAAGAGAATPAAPTDPAAAAQALVDAAQQGDVGAVWELLSPAVRAGVLDWRGLVGRLPALRERLAPVGGPTTTTTVTTPLGPVAVVAPAVSDLDATDAGRLVALTFVTDGGARLASLLPADVSWAGPQGSEATVVASGPSRPVALVVDGVVWSSAPEGATGLQASAAGLDAGPHMAVAVVVDGDRVAASAHLFALVTPTIAEPPPGPGSGEGSGTAGSSSASEPADAATAGPTTVPEGTARRDAEG